MSSCGMIRGLPTIPASNMDDSIRGVLVAEGRGLYKECPVPIT
jgi:hypothetical protein